jgi:hypothetical protein
MGIKWFIYVPHVRRIRESPISFSDYYHELIKKAAVGNSVNSNAGRPIANQAKTERQFPLKT